MFILHYRLCNVCCQLQRYCHLHYRKHSNQNFVLPTNPTIKTLMCNIMHKQLCQRYLYSDKSGFFTKLETCLNETENPSSKGKPKTHWSRDHMLVDTRPTCICIHTGKYWIISNQLLNRSTPPNTMSIIDTALFTMLNCRGVSSYIKNKILYLIGLRKLE